MRVTLISEAPGIPSSLGKVALNIATGLAELGYEVHVVPHSFSTAPTLFSRGKKINPCKYTAEHGDPLATLYPCVDIHLHPWGRTFPISELDVVRSSDVLIVYSYPYADLDLNDIAYKLFTSKGKPSIIYALHEGPYIDPAATLSVMAHSIVAFPSRYLLNQYLDGLAKATRAPREVYEPYMAVLPHPVNTMIYSSKGVEAVANHCNPVNVPRDLLVGMVAKNHIRKDYKALLEAVVKARIQTGLDIVAGLYWIDLVSGTYWKKPDLVKNISLKLGVDEKTVEESVVLLPDQYRALGVTESELLCIYTRMMDLHMFLTRGEAYGLPPVETSLLGVPTITSDIPVQREIFGEKMRYVKTTLLERDDYILHGVDPEDAASAIVEHIEGKTPTPDIDALREHHDYRIVARELAKIIDAAMKTPRPLSEKTRIR